MSPRRAALVTLGCARNEVDSEELAGRLAAGGWDIVDDPSGADAVLVNTCGFIAAAKKDSVDALLEAADAAGGSPVVAVGCMAERYGRELADALPEASAVLGFDDYPAIASRLDAIVSGERPSAHTPRDRRTLLPITPADRVGSGVSTPGHGAAETPLPAGPGPRTLRRRLTGGPVASLKLASGCDRRCAFCAIPSFRGAFVSRLPEDILAEAEALAADGVRELVLVSENSTAYGKDLGDVRLLEQLLPALASVSGVLRVRVAYLQPAELRPGLLETILTTAGVAPYLDLSFQHASGEVLRRMRRFGDGERFLDLLAEGRRFAPELGARSNVIVGFPGETRADVKALTDFLEAARLDAVGVFGYSDEDGTEAVGLPAKVGAATIGRRLAKLVDLAEQLTAARAEERIGSLVEVLVEEVDGDDGVAEGRAAHQAPEVDGSCEVRWTAGEAPRVGELVRARVVGSNGVDLVTELTEVLVPTGVER
ncbi:MAG TPA: 30S ribosomal protein S12 methylthiotransferase RimO [Frankiaceae bacterium]|jgi:ribosomal protein S12 methylthiotransferase RimO|nr:30S ribosomal protein S12 methylthiotransferase RimO [Frankiaceae bacterium]